MVGERVLIVDDDADFRALLRRHLEAEGFEVREAGGGRAGVDAAVSDPPDVIMLDHRMPDMTGIEALAELRRSDVTVPVIAVTAWGDEDVATRFLTQGATEYLAKDHVSPLRLTQTIRAALWVARGDGPGSQVAPATAVDRVLVITARDLEDLPLSAVRSDRANPTEVKRARTVEEGTELIEASRPACVLFDARTASDVASDVGRLLKAAPGLPVVVLASSEGQASQALQAGAADYILQGQVTPLRVHHTLQIARDGSAKRREDRGSGRDHSSQTT